MGVTYDDRMTYGWYPQSQIRDENLPGLGVVFRHGNPHPQASSWRRWTAATIDAALVIVGTVVWVLVCEQIMPRGQASMVVAVLGYPTMLVIAGVLYGLRASPGQLICAVVSLRVWTGRRVGAWRGAWRYIGVGLAPLWILVYLGAALTNGANPTFGYQEPVAVVHRRLN